MKINFPFDSIKGNFLYIQGEKSHNSVDKNDLFIDYGGELDDRFVKYLCLLRNKLTCWA